MLNIYRVLVREDGWKVWEIEAEDEFAARDAWKDGEVVDEGQCEYHVGDAIPLEQCRRRDRFGLFAEMEDEGTQ